MQEIILKTTGLGKSFKGFSAVTDVNLDVTRGTILGPVVGAGIVVGLQNYLANIGSWSTIATGFIFVLCVLAFRRGVVGEIAAHFKNKN